MNKLFLGLLLSGLLAVASGCSAGAIDDGSTDDELQMGAAVRSDLQPGFYSGSDPNGLPFLARIANGSLTDEYTQSVHIEFPAGTRPYCSGTTDVSVGGSQTAIDCQSSSGHTQWTVIRAAADGFSLKTAEGTSLVARRLNDDFLRGTYATAPNQDELCQPLGCPVSVTIVRNDRSGLTFSLSVNGAVAFNGTVPWEEDVIGPARTKPFPVNDLSIILDIGARDPKAAYAGGTYEISLNTSNIGTIGSLLEATSQP